VSVGRRKLRRTIYAAALLAWGVLASYFLIFYHVPYYMRVVAETGRWYDYNAVVRLAPSLLLIHVVLISFGELVPSRRRLLLASGVPFGALALLLTSAALLAGGPDVHTAFGLTLTLCFAAILLYSCVSGIGLQRLKG